MATELEPGAVLRDKYRVERVIGRGGMGCVLAAWHQDLERRVAIKVLLSELRGHRELVERFLREARAASRLDGDHIARILDVDRLADGTPFIVMEYLEGHDLSQVRRTRTPCAIRDAVEYVIQACDAIGQAHDSGIVHRDIKPANLFLTRTSDGRQKIKVLDFGISKMSSPLGGSEPSMTKTSVVMGTAEYMSPEQMLSARDVDGRTDIWALGVVLFEILTASPPFFGETLPQVCALVLSTAPPRPRTLRPDVPEALEQVILRCLQRDRDDRFATAGDLALALKECLSSTNPGLGPAAIAIATDPVPLPTREVMLLPPFTPGQGMVHVPTPPAPPQEATRTTGGTSISPPPLTLSASHVSQPGTQVAQPISHPRLSGAPPTHTPYSRDYPEAPPAPRGRAGLVIGLVLGLAAVGVGVAVGVQSLTRAPAARTAAAEPTPSTPVTSSAKMTAASSVEMTAAVPPPTDPTEATGSEPSQPPIAPTPSSLGSTPPQTPASTPPQTAASTPPEAPKPRTSPIVKETTTTPPIAPKPTNSSTTGRPAVTSRGMD